jgi:hypothetical protein
MGDTCLSQIRAVDDAVQQQQVQQQSKQSRFRIETTI